MVCRRLAAVAVAAVGWCWLCPAKKLPRQTNRAGLRTHRHRGDLKDVVAKEARNVDIAIGVHGNPFRRKESIPRPVAGGVDDLRDGSTRCDLKDIVVK